ncbi:hypothetical protein J1N35_016217 [Gossypium stocksii]|uniref:Uncharacterized protein n=1 Tax=Gossypium stocksii TaxID=47602 RepID=A0A9D4A528_9ROSI|nr:hypothetical protein J1N35_016217 [Gossypium stocksii]
MVNKVTKKKLKSQRTFRQTVLMLNLVNLLHSTISTMFSHAASSNEVREALKDEQLQKLISNIYSSLDALNELDKYMGLDFFAFSVISFPPSLSLFSSQRKCDGLHVISFYSRSLQFPYLFQPTVKLSVFPMNGSIIMNTQAL